MKKHIHSEIEFNTYLNNAEDYYEDGAFEFAEKAVDISRTLGISLDDAEFLIETHNVFIPRYKDRDIAIMVLEMDLTFVQAKKLYEAGFHMEDMAVQPVDPFDLENPADLVDLQPEFDNGYDDIEEQPF